MNVITNVKITELKNIFRIVIVLVVPDDITNIILNIIDNGNGIQIIVGAIELASKLNGLWRAYVIDVTVWVMYCKAAIARGDFSMYTMFEVECHFFSHYIN